MTDNRALNPIKGRIRKLLDQCGNKIHVIDMASNTDKRIACIYITQGKEIVYLNHELVKSQMMIDSDFICDKDFFPDRITAKINKALIENLGLYAQFEIHTADKCSNAGTNTNKTTEQE